MINHFKKLGTWYDTNFIKITAIALLVAAFMLSGYYFYRKGYETGRKACDPTFQPY